MKIAIVTAGGAGMYCGSCMHDNTLAAALLACGQDVQLIPTYTPIRTDEEDVSDGHVFLGGINVYLHQKSSLWRDVPPRLRRLLDSPRLLGMLSSLGLKTDPGQLGELTLSMLRGEQGRQSQELDPLVEFLAKQTRPDVIVLSNALLLGVVSPLRRRCKAPILCLLQGDDVFTEGLAEPFRTEAISLLRTGVRQIDGFLVHSRYYGDFMAKYVDIAQDRIHRVPLGLKLDDFRGSPNPSATGRGGTGKAARHAEQWGHSTAAGGGRAEEFRIGYFARICPQKGLHHLVDAVGLLRRKHSGVRLCVGGYLGAGNREYFEQLCDKARRNGTPVEYVGETDRAEKIRFLHSLEVLSVPTVYREPKGLYVLEALAAGVPVVLPNHGAFPEIIEQTGGGLLVEPQNTGALAGALERMYLEPATRDRLGAAGHAAVRERFNTRVMAESTLEVFRQYVEAGSPAGCAQGVIR